MTYTQYLQTEHWQQLRVDARRKYDHKCAICLSVKPLEVHHFRYRSNWFTCTVPDLVVLCEACHEMVHREKSDRLSAAQLREKYRDRFMHKPPPLTKAERRRLRTGFGSDMKNRASEMSDAILALQKRLSEQKH
jgi:5-methylcytosine-specific restriction endonuclease McrA